MQPMKNIVFENAYQKNARTLLDKLNSAEAILVGAAAGMSASCGYNFFYQNDAIFQKYLGDFHKKYGFTGAFNGFYYHYPSPEAHWAFLVRMGYMEYECPTGQPYYDLMELLEGKNYHIMTTNQDFQFTRVVSEEKLSAIQGDFRYYQCSRRCHDQIYYNKDMVYAMNAAIDENLCIPAKMIPRCPKCGAQMEPWVRGYTFLEGAKYRDEYRKINEFLEKNKEKKILFLELGVGRMTPMFIQEPFWNLTYSLPKAFYITINPKDALLPEEIEQKGLAIKEDIALVLQEAVRVKKEENKEHGEAESQRHPWNSNGPTIQNIFTVCGICLQVSYIWLLRLYLPEKIREMTPGVIRLPFWEMTARNSQVFYVCLNREASSAPEH